MRTPARVLIADDNPANVDILQTRLAVHGYEILTAADGEEALALAREKHPDLILLDVMMPKLDGFEVCRRLKADPSLPFMPVILVTARAESKDVVTGLEAGADEYLTKPVDQAALVARVKSMLRIKTLHDQAQDQAQRLEAQATELAQWNATLEQRVQEQVGQLERLGRLKRFFSPQLAELIVAGGAEDPLKTHRRDITVVFLDLRGFTAFTESAEPEEVIDVLHEYHAEMGRIIVAHEGTIERFAGDGIMVFFNDPVPLANPAEHAVQMALEMRERFASLAEDWRRQGFELGHRHRHRAGLRHHRRDRFRRALGLRRDRRCHEPRRAALQRGRSGADPGRPQGAREGREPRRVRAGRRARAQGLPAARGGVQHQGTGARRNV